MQEKPWEIVAIPHMRPSDVGRLVVFNQLDGIKRVGRIRSWDTEAVSIKFESGSEERCLPDQCEFTNSIRLGRRITTWAEGGIDDMGPIHPGSYGD